MNPTDRINDELRQSSFESIEWKKISLANLDHMVINLWKNINVIDKILEQTKYYQEVIFLDGPPFATGTMHYGHILVSIIKDMLNRYLTMHGKKVDKRNSFDCHGVPIEMLAKKKIGYKTKKELLDLLEENEV